MMGPIRVAQLISIVSIVIALVYLSIRRKEKKNIIQQKTCIFLAGFIFFVFLYDIFIIFFQKKLMYFAKYDTKDLI